MILPNPLIIGAWYNIKLTAVKNTFTIAIVKEMDPKNDNKYGEISDSLKLKIVDSAFKSGFYGIFIDYISKVYWDNIEVKPTECIKSVVDNTDTLKGTMFTIPFKVVSWVDLKDWFIPLSSETSKDDSN